MRIQNPVMWSKISCMQIRKSEPSTMFFKYSHSQDTYLKLNTTQRPRKRGENERPVNNLGEVLQQLRTKTLANH